MDSSRRRPLSDLLGDDDNDDLGKGEYVPADDYESSHDTDDDGRFVRRSSRREDDEAHLEQGGRMRRLEDIIGVGRADAGAGAPPLLPASPTPSSESEGTISDDNRSVSSAGVAVGGARPARKFACHVCGKGFSSRKAVDGHMRVHSGSGRHVVPAPAEFSAGWAATGRRGSTGGKGKPSAAAASLNSESTGHYTAIVEVQVKPLEPVPMAFAMATNLSPMPSSTRTNLSGEDDEGSSASATDTATAQPMHCDDREAAAVVTGANPSSTGAGARAAEPVDHQLAAAADQAPPAPQVHRQAVSVPPPVAQEAYFAQQPPVPLPTATVQLQQGGQLVPRPAQPPREYSCKVCGKTYSTHQGLGGHAAGHRNRQREQEAMAAAAGMMMPHGGAGEFLAELRRGRKAEEPHACQKCDKVFATGVALGGHMRMHYTGPPIVHKSKKRCVALVAVPPPPVVSEADLRLALSTAKTEEPSSSHAPAVAGTGRLRLFGVDIGPLVQQAPPSEQQGSGTTEGSSSAGDQQHQHK